MNKRIFIALGTLAVSIVGCVQTNKNSRDIPAIAIDKGVSAPFAGFIDYNMIVAGGCNFPNIPAAEGGAKVYYPDVFTIDINGKNAEWEREKELPIPIAYGATVETQEGLVCIGGMNSDTRLNNVYNIKKDKQGKLTIKELPSLPESIDNAAATSIGNYIYVTGGQQGSGGQSLYMLNIDKDTLWTRLADYPGYKRIQPILIGGDDKLYLFGGFDLSISEVATTDEGNSKVSAVKEGRLSSNFIVYDIEKNEWSEQYPIPNMSDGSPRALVGAAGVRINDMIVIAGGVNYSIFKSAIEGKLSEDYLKHPASWYKFSKDVLIYDLKTKDWKITPDVEGFNKAGGVLLHKNGVLYMVCGETKPGIRTNEIASMLVKDIQKEAKLYKHQ